MDNLRLAVVSTPRSGNSWLRHMLAQVFELDQIIVHLPDEIPWHNLPARAIAQLHWPADDAAFVARLAEHGFRVVVAARHPLDVLISILAFCQHDDSTLRWLGGAAQDERLIHGAWPLSDAFIEYCLGPRADSLLGVSTAWWQMPGVCRVRYEDLLADTAGVLGQIAATLGAQPRRSIDEVVGQSTPDKMRTQNIHMLYHVWQAQTDLWKCFLTASVARQICETHSKTLISLGYRCDPDESLTIEGALTAWDRFDTAAVKRNVIGVKRELCEVHARHHRDRCELDQQNRELDQQRRELERQSRELERQLRELEELRRQLTELPLDQLREFPFAELRNLGPWSLGAAHTLNQWSGRFPRASAHFKSLAGWFRRSAPTSATR